MLRVSETASGRKLQAPDAVLMRLLDSALTAEPRVCRCWVHRRIQKIREIRMQEFEPSGQSAGAAKIVSRSEAADGGDIPADRQDKLDRRHAERCNGPGLSRAAPVSLGAAQKKKAASSRTRPVLATFAKPLGESGVGRSRSRQEVRSPRAKQSQNRRAPPASILMRLGTEAILE